MHDWMESTYILPYLGIFFFIHLHRCVVVVVCQGQPSTAQSQPCNAGLPPQADKLIGRMAATAAVPYWMGGCFSWASFPRGAAHTQALQGKHSSLESRCLLSRHRVHMPFSLDHSRLELDPFPLCHRRASSSERRAPSLPGPRAVKVFSPLVPFEVSNARFQARQSQLARAGSAGKLASTHTHIRTYIVHAHARLACRPACLP